MPGGKRKKRVMFINTLKGRREGRWCREVLMAVLVYTTMGYFTGVVAPARWHQCMETGNLGLHIA